MKVDLLYVDGCPCWEPLLRSVRELLRGANIDANVEPHLIQSDEEARRQRFLGSPTLRIDGRDVEPGADTREDHGIKCRMYRTPVGIECQPARAWIVAALRRDDRTKRAETRDDTTGNDRADSTT